jgi:predicted ArsR family transcriptional regulator
LAHRLGINKGNIAQHLGVLVQAGLARKEPTRTGRGGAPPLPPNYKVPTGDPER